MFPDTDQSDASYILLLGVVIIEVASIDFHRVLMRAESAAMLLLIRIILIFPELPSELSFEERLSILYGHFKHHSQYNRRLEIACSA